MGTWPELTLMTFCPFLPVSACFTAVSGSFTAVSDSFWAHYWAHSGLNVPYSPLSGLGPPYDNHLKDTSRDTSKEPREPVNEPREPSSTTHLVHHLVYTMEGYPPIHHPATYTVPGTPTLYHMQCCPTPRVRAAGWCTGGGSWAQSWETAWVRGEGGSSKSLPVKKGRNSARRYTELSYEMCRKIG